MMLMNPEQEALIARVFEAYVTEHHHADILQLIADTNEEIHYPVVVNAMTLFEANMEVGDYFNAYPDDVLAVFDKVLLRKCVELSKEALPMDKGGQRIKEQRMRLIPHARITGLPVCPELTRDTIPRSRDVGHFLSVTGTVIRTSVTKILEYERDYMCTKCRHVFTVQADFEQFYTFVQVATCPNPDGCNSFKFTCLSGGAEPAVCRDYQEIKIQEQVQRLSVGSIPRSVVVVLEDDLVDSCKSGDDVTVYGVVCQRWKPFYEGSCCDVDLVLKANNIEVNNQQATAALVLKDVQKEFDDFWLSFKHDPVAGRNQILLSLCPQVFGMYLIKLAVAMVLAGGVQRIDSSGTKIRGECHMLLVGDPGTGKSQFLKYAAKVIPRSVLTAGIGSTSAGLTVAAVKDGGDWHLEAGALVLSDGGLCCIDEFNSIKEHDRISIHEAMEQQSISVAKAGMVCKLNTRTTILAATNPKGQYDPNESLSVNVALASPLLSRFDLVLVLMDTRNAEWDRIISSFILEDRDSGGICSESSSLWSMEKMKAYFSVIKRLQPQVSEEANSILSRYYQLQRQSNGRNSARTTIRMLESLGRLAEAHARLMYRQTVTIEDAVMAVSVMECSMQGGALLGSVNALLTSFPDDPGQQYESQCQILLTGLNLPVLLQKELDRLARLKGNASEASPPSDRPPHQLSDARSIRTTPRDDISRNSNDDDLDWFHSISPPAEMTSPTITSTQENLRKPRPSWLETSTARLPVRQRDGDILNTSGSFLTCDVVTNLFETTSAQSESIKDKSSKIQRSDKQKSPNQAESPECVFQKVSKNLRDRRLHKLELNHQLSDQEGGERASSRAAPRVHVTDMTSETHTSNSLSSGKQDERRQKIVDGAETSKDIQAKLSGFVFKPKKMKPSAPDLNASSRDFHSSSVKGTSKQRLGCHSDSDTDQGKRKKQNQAGSVSSRTEANICLTSEEPHNENQSRLQRSGDGFKPSSSVTDPAPAKSDQTKFTVASTTLAKLSRFSFCSTPELTTTAQVQVGKHPLTLKDNPAVSKCKEQQAEAATATTSYTVKTMQVGVDCQSSVNMKKRKCFELNPAPPGACGSQGFYSGLPLFGSSDFSNDVLDTDWDQEVSKKAKG